MDPIFIFFFFPTNFLSMFTRVFFCSWSTELLAFPFTFSAAYLARAPPRFSLLFSPTRSVSRSSHGVLDLFGFFFEKKKNYKNNDSA